jgi:GNAT superfamily N-acetyltransferase
MPDNSPPSIRLAAPPEREMLEALQWRASLANAGDRDALLSHPDAIALPPGQIEANQVVVADRGGAIVGFAAVLRRKDGDVELDGLFVEPRIWRSGVGRALVSWCARYARAHDAAFLRVIANPHARAFYDACGFEVVGTCETRFGIGLVMRIKIS